MVKYRNIYKSLFIRRGMEKIGINIIIEQEGNTFIASSLDINVLAEGKSRDEAREKFIEGANFHFESFPEDRKLLIKPEKEKFEMPSIQRIFLWFKDKFKTLNNLKSIK